MPTTPPGSALRREAQCVADYRQPSLARGPHEHPSPHLSERFPHPSPTPEQLFAYVTLWASLSGSRPGGCYHAEQAAPSLPTMRPACRHPPSLPPVRYVWEGHRRGLFMPPHLGHWSMEEGYHSPPSSFMRCLTHHPSRGGGGLPPFPWQALPHTHTHTQQGEQLQGGMPAQCGAAAGSHALHGGAWPSWSLALALPGGEAGHWSQLGAVVGGRRGSSMRFPLAQPARCSAVLASCAPPPAPS